MAAIQPQNRLHSFHLCNKEQLDWGPLAIVWLVAAPWNSRQSAAEDHHPRLTFGLSRNRTESMHMSRLDRRRIQLRVEQSESKRRPLRMNRGRRRCENGSCNFHRLLILYGLIQFPKNIFIVRLVHWFIVRVVHDCTSPRLWRSQSRCLQRNAQTATTAATDTYWVTDCWHCEHCIHRIIVPIVSELLWELSLVGVSWLHFNHSRRARRDTSRVSRLLKYL